MSAPDRTGAPAAPAGDRRAAGRPPSNAFPVRRQARAAAGRSPG